MPLLKLAEPYSRDHWRTGTRPDVAVDSNGDEIQVKGGTEPVIANDIDSLANVLQVVSELPTLEADNA